MLLKCRFKSDSKLRNQKRQTRLWTVPHSHRGWIASYFYSQAIFFLFHDLHANFESKSVTWCIYICRMNVDFVFELFSKTFWFIKWGPRVLVHLEEWPDMPVHLVVSFLPQTHIVVSRVAYPQPTPPIPPGLQSHLARSSPPPHLRSRRGGAHLPTKRR